MNYQAFFSQQNKKKKNRMVSSALVTGTLAFLVKFSADDSLKYISFFTQKTGFDISCKTCFQGKKKKNISACRLLIILPRVLSVKGKKK